MIRARGILIWIGAIALALCVSSVRARERVDIIVTFNAGSAPDLVARVVADILRDSDYEVTVKNISGANGEIGLQVMQNAGSSRLTFLVALNSLLVINPHLYSRSAGDLEWSGTQPVMFLGRNTSNFIVVRSDAPFETLDELVKTRSAEGRDLKYATNGVGSLYHLAFEKMLIDLGDFPRIHAPYKSNSEVLQSLMAGDVDVSISGTSALPLLKSRRLKAIGVLGHQPSSLYPNATPLARRFVDIPLVPWFSLVSNRAISSVQLQDVRDKVRIGLREDNHRDKLRAHGIQVEDLSEKQFLSLWQKELIFFRTAVKKLQINKPSE